MEAAQEMMLAIPSSQLIILEKIPVEIAAKEFEHQSMFKKLLFFFLREGINQTMAKIKSFRYSQFLNSQSSFIIGQIKDTNLYVCGKQYGVSQPVFYFSPKLVLNHKPDPESLKQVLKYEVFSGFEPEFKGSENQHLANQLLFNYPFKPISISKTVKKKKQTDPDLYIIGCGSYTRTHVLPVFKSFHHKFACDLNPTILENKYLDTFEYRSNSFLDMFDICKSDNHSIALIASYHSNHSEQAVSILSRLEKIKVFIEKPPCVSGEDLDNLLRVFDTNRVAVGYNRRYIPWNRLIRDLIHQYDAPVSICFNIKEVQVPEDHWYHWPNQGTRIAGNLSHWFDLSVYWIDSPPRKLFVSRNDVLGIDHSTFVVIFENGSTATFLPDDRGDLTRGVQEFISIRSESYEVTVNDYTYMKIWEEGKTRRFYNIRRDKGHSAMYKDFIRRVRSGQPFAYTHKDLIYSTELYIKCIEAYMKGMSEVELSFEKYRK
jgi:predicted dehydrogenase